MEIAQTKIANICIAFCTERELDQLVRAEAQESPRTRYIIVRGQRCADEASLFAEWAAALQFPYYFGNTWDELDNCLGKLEWLAKPGYEALTVAIANVDRILEDFPERWPTLLSILSTAPVDLRSGNDTPIRFLLHCSPERRDATMLALSIGGLDPIENLSTCA
ncbi:MAG: barstar family protein [Candidatus Eremiobacteraeota bacterium]|nr:barstar family protein [Candidatus Eremiobacteraeota bacterium]